MPDEVQEIMLSREMTAKEIHLPDPAGSWDGLVYPIDPPVKMKAGRVYVVGVRDDRGVVEPEVWLRWRWRQLRRRFRA